MENSEEKLSCNQDPCPVDRWTISYKKCTTCCECIDACRKGLLYYYEPTKVIRIEDELECIHCGDCASACAFGAIVLT